MEKRKKGGMADSSDHSDDEDDLRPSTTSRKRRKTKLMKGVAERRGRGPAVFVDSSTEEEEEQLRRALELSRKEAASCGSDSDEDMKRAIALSLQEVEVESTPVLAKPAACENSCPTLVISDDEFDQMCSNNMSLKERLSKSSLDSEDDEGSVQIVTNRMMDEDNANLPGPSNIPVTKRKGLAGGGASSFNDSGGKIADSVSSSSSVAAGGPSGSQSGQRSRGSRPVQYISDEEEESELAATCSSYLPQNSHPYQLLSSSEVRERMRSVFTRGLENHLTQEEMEPCKAIATRLHPHQKTALAWMVKQENKEMQGMQGGILADDMGLGKTLTVISLILTNFHDGRPLCKPDIGYTRPPLELLRMSKKGGRKKVVPLPAAAAPDASTVGSKIRKNKERKSAFGFFDKFKEFDGMEKNDPKDRLSNGSGEKSKGKRNDGKPIDLSSSESGDIGEASEDEFDRMSQDSSLSLRLNVSSRDSFKTVADPRDQEADQMLAELENLSREERSQRLRPVLLTDDDDDLPNPALSLDGAYDTDSDDDADISPVNDGRRRKAGRICSEDDDEAVAAKVVTASSSSFRNGSKKAKTEGDSDSDIRLSDIDLENVAPAPSSCPVPSVSTEALDNGGVRRLYPPRDPAELKGRRRATLLVCPTSLISHWCQEIDKHVDPSVFLRVKVHYGSSKALTGADLNSCDIVITTYGTLASEFGSEDAGPLHRAKFLRVVLDEGHVIRNHRTKSSKAANKLDTQRRWVITGTPIQNNLLELWSLVHWLRFGVYADQLPVYKNHIERPCKSRNPRGFERLQVLMDAICLRRTKSDRRANGDPIVKLPSKTVKIREVEFTEEERLCYNIFNSMAKDVVMNYQRRGQLLRHYAHIFALMMRMRQMCCHRELINCIDWGVTLRDKELLERELGQLVAEDGGSAAGGEDDAQQHLITQLRGMLSSGITDDCSICLDDLKTPVITPCAHVFCRLCIERCLDAVKPPACPLCRRHIEKAQLLEAGNYDQESERTEDATLAAMKDIIVQHTSSKVDAVLKEILRIQRDMPADKIVVVSQFTSFLSVIQPLLDERGITYDRLDGSMSHIDRTEVVRKFQRLESSAPRILLLSLKAGGVGLNLTAANHLLLLDPAWNPAAEWQCFDRVHRLGQEKDVFIYKFITKESIEIKMMQLQEKKEELINGAFIMPDEDRRRQRIQDILDIFGLA